MPNTLLVVENSSVPTDPRVWPECNTLKNAGWDVTVICPQGSSRDQPASEIVDGVEIHRYPPGEHGGGIGGYIGEYTRAFWEIRRLVGRLSDKSAFTVVHAATPPDILLLTAWPLRRAGTAAILDHHDLSPELFEAKFGRRSLAYRSLLHAERAGFRLADVVISPNESFRQLAVTRGGVDPENVFVVRNGPDPQVFRPLEPDPALRAKAEYLLGYVGLMGSQDGVLEALEGLAILKRRRSDWHAIFVGHGDALPDAQRRTVALGLEREVTFVGFVADRERLVRMIASCDVCLSPEPRNELNDNSTLIKIAEYMSVGRPIVAFDLRETAATAGAAAVLTADISGWAAAIDDLLDDPPRRIEMGEVGRARVLGELSWAHSQTSLLGAYGRAVERSSTRWARRHVL